MSATTGFTSKMKAVGNKFSPTIIAFDLTAANTEESYTLPANSTYFCVQNRGKTVLRLAYDALETADNGNYLSIFPGSERSVDSISSPLTTIYLRAGTASRVEIESWS